MKIVLTPLNALALAALSFVMQETHELAHTLVGRLLCGCWGRRNFNVWGLCADCAAQEPLTVLATFAGPAYSFAVIWIGYVMLSKRSTRAASVGFALIIASMPFSRVLTPIFGSGDEIFGLRVLGVDRSAAWPIGLLVVLALAVPPVVRIYRTIANRHRGWWMAGLLLVPFFMIGAVVFGVLQTLVLGNGILAADGVLGSPIIVTVWFGVSAGILLAVGRHLTTLLRPADARAA
jgi:hypothetical protein